MVPFRHRTNGLCARSGPERQTLTSLWRIFDEHDTLTWHRLARSAQPSYAADTYTVRGGRYSTTITTVPVSMRSLGEEG